MLVADGRANLDLWDPAGDHGPTAADELPLSPTLRYELDRLRTALHERNASALPGTLDGLISSCEHEALDGAVRGVWRRLRAELGNACEVGYQGPGMQQPLWAPGEPADGEDDDIPF